MLSKSEARKELGPPPPLVGADDEAWTNLRPTPLHWCDKDEFQEVLNPIIRAAPQQLLAMLREAAGLVEDRLRRRGDDRRVLFLRDEQLHELAEAIAREDRLVVLRLAFLDRRDLGRRVLRLELLRGLAPVGLLLLQQQPRLLRVDLGHRAANKRAAAPAPTALLCSQTCLHTQGASSTWSRA